MQLKTRWPGKQRRQAVSGCRLHMIERPGKMERLQRIMRRLALCLYCILAAAACSAQDGNGKDPATVFSIAAVTELPRPWAMTFLPDGRLLITAKKGQLLLVTQEGESSEVSGVPVVDYGGQGGLGDVILHPDFTSNGVVYLSYAEAGEGGTRGAAVARATPNVF